MSNNDQLWQQQMFDFMREFKADVDRRFEQIDKRFEQMDKKMDRQFDALKDELKDIKYDLRMDQQKLEKVYDERRQVTVKFTQAWSLASMFIAIIASFFTLAIAKGAGF